MRTLSVLAVVATASLGASQGLPEDTSDNVFPKSSGAATPLVKYATGRLVRHDVLDLITLDTAGVCRVNYAPTLHRWGFDLPWSDVADIAVQPGGGTGGRDAVLLARPSEVRRTWIVDGAFQSNIALARGVDLLAADDLDGDARQEILCADGANLLIVWGTGGLSVVPIGAPILQLGTAGYVAGATRQVVVRTGASVLVMEGDGTIHDVTVLPTADAAFTVMGRPGDSDTVVVVETGLAGARQVRLMDDEMIGSLPITISLSGAFEVASFNQRIILHEIGSATAIEMDVGGPFVAQTSIDLGLPAARTAHHDLDEDGLVDHVREAGSNVAVAHTGDWTLDGDYAWSGNDLQLFDSQSTTLGWPVAGIIWDITIWSMSAAAELEPIAVKRVAMPHDSLITITDVLPPLDSQLLMVMRPIVGGVTGPPGAVLIPRASGWQGSTPFPPTVEPPITTGPPPDADDDD